MLLEQFKLPQFRSRQHARDFWAKNDDRKFEMRRFFLFFGVLAFAAHGLLDITAGGEQAYLLLTVRGISVAAMLAIACVFSTKNPNFRADTLVSIYLGVAAFAILMMCILVKSGTAADTYPFGLVILAAYGGTVLVPRCLKMTVFCVAAYVTYLGTIPFSSISMDALVVNLFFVTVGLLAVMLGAVTRERLERNQMLADISMEEMHDDLAFSKEEAIAARDAAIEARQAQAKFITSVSHELRTPLNAIIGFSDLMLNEIDGPVTPSSYHGYVQDIHRSGNGLLVNINDLLDVHRLNAGKMSWVDERFSLDEMVRNAVTLCHHESENSNVTLIAPPSGIQIDAFGDITRMTQVITNLLTNAMKFTDAGGHVTVTQTLLPDGELRVSVADNGIGIAPDDLDRIKDPFQQAEDGELAKKKGGLGLGLAIVGGIMDQIGGRFEMESELNVGTVCHVFIPAEKLFVDEEVDVA